MKKSKKNLLIGCGVRIDFHAWTPSESDGRPRKDFLRDVLGTRKHLEKFDGQRGTIVDMTDEGYLVRLGGQVDTFLDLDFTIITDAQPDRTEELLERIAVALETIVEKST